MPLFHREFDFAPYRLSGVVYGTLINDPRTLEAIGDKASEAPYKSPPKAPVLYVKPRNTLSHTGAAVSIPVQFDSVQIRANVGIVIGKTACRVSESDALSHVAGYVAINDVALPHDSFYRPSIRFIARDGYCPIGDEVVPAAAIGDVNALAINVWIDEQLVHQSSTAGRLRSAAKLLADVTEFMTLQPGDILMLGFSHSAPLARAGQHVVIEIEGLGRIENTVIAEGDAQ